MNTRLFFLPALALGGAALLVLPSPDSRAFSTIGGSLGEAQRDVRVFDNFNDSFANDNVTPAAQFPGYTGCELAIWKGIVEWGSDLHGDGTGDPLSGNLLGNGEANFDAFWCGNATEIGSANQNIVSAVASCAGDTLAFTETPISDGWRIRFCDNWTWDNGPGFINPNFDIQGIMAHEYGHALGLGHSAVMSATMWPSGGPGQFGLRSIAADDTAGVQFIYGVEEALKPQINATSASGGPGGTITIYGTNFDGFSNDVWFTRALASAGGAEPRVLVLNAPANGNGTEITVTIPAEAGPGDVIVNVPGAGHDTVSNAFPTDLIGDFGNVPIDYPHTTTHGPVQGGGTFPAATAFVLNEVVPATIEALIPGTEQTVTLRGFGLDRVTSITLGDQTIEPERYTIVDATTITLDMPLAASLGTQVISVSDGVDVVPFEVTIAPSSAPRFELGSGDPLDTVDVDDGLRIVLAGEVGKTHTLFVSHDATPSTNAFVDLLIGNQFATLGFGGTFVIPEQGWVEITVPTEALFSPAPGGTVLYSQSVVLDPPRPWPASNLQSVVLVR